MALVWGPNSTGVKGNRQNKSPFRICQGAASSSFGPFGPCIILEPVRGRVQGVTTLRPYIESSHHMLGFGLCFRSMCHWTVAVNRFVIAQPSLLSCRCSSKSKFLFFWPPCPLYYLASSSDRHAVINSPSCLMYSIGRQRKDEFCTTSSSILYIYKLILDVGWTSRAILALELRRQIGGEIQWKQ